MIEEIEYKGCKIKKCYDECSTDPREWSNLGTIYSNHRRINPDGHSVGEILDEEKGVLSKEFEENNLFLHVYMYEHSGYAFRTSETPTNPFGNGLYAQFDSGWFGVIAISKEKVRKEYGVKRISPQLKKRVLGYLKGEIDIYDQYANGKVYGYVCEDEEGDEIDSCWGYYDDEDLFADAKDAIDWHLKQRAEREAKEEWEEYTANFTDALQPETA